MLSAQLFKGLLQCTQVALAYAQLPTLLGLDALPPITHRAFELTECALQLLPEPVSVGNVALFARLDGKELALVVTSNLVDLIVKSEYALNVELFRALARATLLIDLILFIILK